MMACAVASLALLAPDAGATPGERMWTATVPSTGEAMSSSVVLADPDGERVYVVGQVRGSGSGWDAYVAALDPLSGAVEWDQRYDGPAHGPDTFRAAALDPVSGVLVATGRARDVGLDDDVITIAFDAATGDRRWEKRRQGGTPTEIGGSVAIARSRAVVSVAGPDQGFLVAYGLPKGGVRWRRPVADGSIDGTTLTSGGRRVYTISTRLLPAPGVASEYLVQGLRSRTGRVIWASTYRGIAGVEADATGGVVDQATRTLYMTGLANSFSVSPVTTIAYDTVSGAQRWLTSLTPPAGWTSSPPIITRSPRGGTIAVTTERFDLSGTSTILTASYLPDGRTAWTDRPSGPEDRGSPRGLVASDDGSVFVTGSGRNVAGGAGSLTLAYPSTGGPPSWSSLIRASGGARGEQVALTADGSVLFVATQLASSLRIDAYATS
jgi:hypothetical protein